jgi:catechol 2,3-dioxygenase-like lactoylglutathione lyase family enzyme
VTDARREYEIGSEHDSAGREAEAIPHYERALELGLTDELVPGALLQLGSSLRNVGRVRDALAVLDGGVARFPDHVALRLFRAFALSSDGRDRDALVDVLDLARTRIDVPEVQRYARSLENYTRDLAQPRLAGLAPFLRVADARASTEWYRRLGFEQEFEHRFEPRLPLFVSVRRGPARLFLSEHRGDARPDTLVYLYVDDVDAVAAEFNVDAETAPWGTRELQLVDPDGNRIRVGTVV